MLCTLVMVSLSLFGLGVGLASPYARLGICLARGMFLSESLAIASGVLCAHASDFSLFDAISSPRAF